MKKKYIQPTIEKQNLKIESLLNTDSEGYEDEFDAKPFVQTIDVDFETWEESEEKADWIEGIEFFPKVL